MSGAGKGDDYRRVDLKKWNENYDRIFGKKNMPTQEQLEALWKACCEWRDETKPSCAESMYQVDSVNTETPELAIAVCDIIGYAKDVGD